MFAPFKCKEAALLRMNIRINRNESEVFRDDDLS